MVGNGATDDVDGRRSWAGRRPTADDDVDVDDNRSEDSSVDEIGRFFCFFFLLVAAVAALQRRQKSGRGEKATARRQKVETRPASISKEAPFVCVCVCVCRENAYCRRHHWSAQKFNGVFFSFFFLLSSGPVESRHATRTKYDEIKTKPDTKKKRPHRRGSTRRSGVTTLDRHWSQSLNDVIVGRSKSRKGAQRLCRRPHNVVAQDGVEPPHWAFIGRNR